MSLVNVVTIYAGSVNSDSLYVATGTITVNTTKFSVGSNLFINTTAISIGNSTTNTIINSTSISTNTISHGANTYVTLGFTNLFSNSQIFTTTGWNVWTKPAGLGNNDIIKIELWGAGGGGNNNCGGGGGGYATYAIPARAVNATCNVYVGNGGISQFNGAGSRFYINVSHYVLAGGGQGGAQGGFSYGGGGGGSLTVGNNDWSDSTDLLNPSYGGGHGVGPQLGDVLFDILSRDSFGMGGGAGANTAGQAGGNSVFGGGGGSVTTGVGGFSTKGGGGGAGTTGSTANTTIFGGKGGNSSVAPTAPGGGGAGSNSLNTTGARGEVRVTVIKR